MLDEGGGNLSLLGDRSGNHSNFGVLDEGGGNLGVLRDGGFNHSILVC